MQKLPLCRMARRSGQPFGRPPSSSGQEGSSADPRRDPVVARIGDQRGDLELPDQLEEAIPRVGVIRGHYV